MAHLSFGRRPTGDLAEVPAPEREPLRRERHVLHDAVDLHLVLVRPASAAFDAERGRRAVAPEHAEDARLTEDRVLAKIDLSI